MLGWFITELGGTKKSLAETLDINIEQRKESRMMGSFLAWAIRCIVLSFPEIVNNGNTLKFEENK